MEAHLYSLVLRQLLNPFDEVSYYSCGLVSRQFLRITREVCSGIVILSSSDENSRFPFNLRSLSLVCDAPVPNIPSVRHLYLGGDFNQRIVARNLPPTLRTLVLKSRFEKELGTANLPLTLETLKFSQYYPHLLVLPYLPSLTNLSLPLMSDISPHFPTSTEVVLPSSLRSLRMAGDFVNLPPALTKLQVHNSYTMERFSSVLLPESLLILRISGAVHYYSPKKFPPFLQEYVAKGSSQPLPPDIVFPLTLRKLSISGPVFSLPISLQSLNCRVYSSSRPLLQESILRLVSLRKLVLSFRDDEEKEFFFPPRLRTLKLKYSPLHLSKENLPPGLRKLSLIQFRGKLAVSDLPSALVDLHWTNKSHGGKATSIVDFPKTLRRLDSPHYLISVDKIRNHLPHLEKLSLYTKEVVSFDNLPRGLRYLELVASQVRNWHFFPRHLQWIFLAKMETVEQEHLPLGLVDIFVDVASKVNWEDICKFPFLESIDYDDRRNDEEFNSFIDELFYRKKKFILRDKNNLASRRRNLQKFLKSIEEICQDDELLQEEYAAYQRYGLDLATKEMIESELEHFQLMSSLRY